MEALVKSYVDWMREGISYRDVGNGWHEVVTPFLNHRNDMIEVYLKSDGDEIVLSDGGNTLNELCLSGVNIESSPKRTRDLDNVLLCFGVSKTEKDELTIRAKTKKFPEAKHRFIQAILAIDDMHMVSRAKVESFFLEDIATYLGLHDMPFVENAAFTGKSGFKHTIDFVLPKTNARRERAIKAINKPKKDNIGSALWMLEDTRLIRPETVGMVILNDEQEVSTEVYKALKEYDIPYMKWSSRSNPANILLAA